MIQGLIDSTFGLIFKTFEIPILLKHTYNSKVQSLIGTKNVYFEEEYQ